MSVENTQNSKPVSFTERAFDRKNLVAGAIGTVAAAAVIASAVAIKSYVGAEPSIFKIPTSFSDVQSSITGFPSWALANQDGFSGATIGYGLGQIIATRLEPIKPIIVSSTYDSTHFNEGYRAKPSPLMFYSIIAASVTSGWTLGAALLKNARSI